MEPGKRRGTPRRRRERAAIPGLLVHQDGSSHEWVAGSWWDLIVTMDDATSEVYSGFFVEEEGTWSSLRGVRETLEKRGLFSSLYTDRGSHYWHTPAAGGQVDKARPTQFGRAMGELGIEMIPSYSPEARGRSERLSLQLPVTHGRHYVKRRVRVCEHADGTLSVFHGPRRLARYDAGGAAPGAMLPVAAS